MILLLACITTGPSDSDTAELEEGTLTPEERAQLADLWPLPAVPDDPTNAVADDPRAAHLGQYLFFDPRLSDGNEVSCSTCHDPTKGWADGLRLAEGVGTAPRHSPSVVNAAFGRWQFWDGRCDTLWCQATGPIEAGAEMGGSRLAVAHLVADDPELTTAYTALFGPLPDLSDTSRFPARGRPTSGEPDEASLAWEGMAAPDRVAVDTVYANVAKAIAAFERRVVSRNSPFDTWAEAVLTEDPDDPTLPLAARRGYQLFVGDAQCVVCHAGPALSNGEFGDIGLGARDWLDNGDRGRIDGIVSLRVNPFNGAGPYSDDPETGQTKIEWLAASGEQEGQFKVPPLRNVAYTAPYMHGGHFDTLADVLAFYGGEAPETPVFAHRESVLTTVELDEREQADLLAFLTSLSGTVDASLNHPPASPVWADEGP